MEKQIVELKARLAEGPMWDDLPVLLTFEVEPVERETGKVLVMVGSNPQATLSEAARFLAKMVVPLGVEFRWNFKGSLQGHYNWM